jgi:regulator of sigma E protease
VVTNVETRYRNPAQQRVLQRIVHSSASPVVTILVERGGEKVMLKAAPAVRDIEGPFGIARVRVLGITFSSKPENSHKVDVPLLTAIGIGLQETWFEINRAYLQIVNASSETDGLAGPIRIAALTSSLHDQFMRLAAGYSIVLFALNLLPIPIGDGGGLLWCGIEAVRERSGSRNQFLDSSCNRRHAFSF